MFHSTNGNDCRLETGSSTASLLCVSTVGYPSDSLVSCLLPAAALVPEQKQITANVLNILLTQFTESEYRFIRY